MRTGAYGLSLLAVPLNVQTLTALAEGPKSLVELRRASGSPPPTTLRGHLRTLIDIGVLERRRREKPQANTAYELAESGRELLGVTATLQAWLAESPDGPLALSDAAAKSAVKALAEGWSTGMIRALASKPLTLTELDRLISDVTYPSLERRLEAMRLTGQIEPSPTKGRGTPYAVTDWLRKSIAPVIAAVHWEQMRLPADAAAAITQIDVEASFMMAVPMLSLDQGLSGVARLAVQMDGDETRLVGVMVTVENGRIASCVTRLEGEAGASAIGSATAWIQAVTEENSGLLRIGGDRRLAISLVSGLHEVLFGGAPKP